MAIDLRIAERSVFLTVHVTPNARRASVGGQHDGALKVSVNVPPEKGKANRAVVDAVAAALDLKRADCVIVSGQSSRRKSLEIHATDLQSIVDRIKRLADERGEASGD